MKKVQLADVPSVNTNVDHESPAVDLAARLCQRPSLSATIVLCCASERTDIHSHVASARRSKPTPINGKGLVLPNARSWKELKDERRHSNCNR
jgi:hypothetical protein